MLFEIATLLRERDITPGYRAQLLCCLRKFVRFAGDSFTAFDDATANAWLADLIAENGRKPKTLKTYRASVLTCWYLAHDAGLVESRPGRIRAIKAHRMPPVAWTHEEICQLLSVCDHESHGDWIAAVIYCTWSSGLRLCDLYQLDAREIDASGTFRLVQQKTRFPHAVHVDDDAREALDKVGGRLRRYRREYVCQVVRKAVSRVPIRQGTIRWLRRSAASYVERERCGCGERFLGHRSGSVAESHYFDPAITGQVVPGPSLRLVASVATAAG